MPRTQQSPDGAHFDQVLAFVAIAEALSFKRAAARLNRDATLLSRRLGALEARLGVRLLERTTRRVALTQAGSLYLDRAAAIVRAMEEADLEAGGFAAEEPRGHLRLALPGSFGRLWLMPAIADFLAAHQKVTIEAEFSNRYVDLVGERFDLAVRLGALANSGLVVRKLGERRRMLCASPVYLEHRGAPRHPVELADRSCLIFAGLRRWDFQAGDGARARVEVAGPLVADDVEALVAAAEAGLGIVLTTDWAAASSLREGRLVQVLAAWTLVDDGAISIVTPSGSHHATKTRVFSDFLAERFRRRPWAQ